MRVLALLAIVACKDDVREVELTREHHSRITYAGVAFATVFEREANVDAPLLVMLHGRGDTPEHLRDSLRDFPVKLQLALPKAPMPFGEGWQWFEPANTADAAEAALWPAIVLLAHGRKLMIGGIDQGATVASAIAAHHAEVITCAFPLAGREVTPATYELLVDSVRVCIQ